MSVDQTKLGKFQMPRVGDVLEGRYRIIEVLATGGMGVILQAKHMRMGRDVAIKILHPHIAQEDNVVARFEREVRLAQMLNHPNTIRLYDFGEAENGLIYVVMELLEGADLKEIIAEEGPLSVGRSVELALQVLDGLGEAHEQDFVHRDLKPSNIFVTKDRRGDDLVKILDFGIAKSLEEGDADLTATGSICGTAAYVAPEYLHDPTPSRAADVYAVGLILLEMLTGKRAFYGTTTAQTLMMQMQREIQLPRPLAATPLGEVIACAAAKDASQRYQTADEMFQALSTIAGELPSDLRLRPQQVGELLRPPSGTFPGMGTNTPNGAARQQDSSTSLPQANHTPPTGEHVTPSVDDLSDDETLITPMPSPLDKTHEEVPLRAPDYSAAANEQSDGKKKRLVMIGGAVVVLAAVAALGLSGVFSADEPNEPAAPAASAQEQQIQPQPQSQAKPAAAPAAEAGEGKEAAQEAEPKVVTAEFRIDSSPAGATVFDGEETLGTTPLDKSYQEAQLPRTLRVTKDGFQDATIELAADSGEDQQVMLVEKTKAEPAAEERSERPEDPPASRRKQPAAKPKKKEGEEDVDEFLDEYL